MRPSQGRYRAGLAVIDKHKVRIFDATGKERAVVGRFGHGPNEFAQLDYLCASRGDTLVVWDQNYRSTIISPTGARPPMALRYHRKK